MTNRERFFEAVTAHATLLHGAGAGAVFAAAPVLADQVVVKALPAGITGKERPQVNVHDDGVVAGAHGYTVKGNGTDGSLEIFNCERVSLFKLVWRDGLITDSIVNHDDGAGDTVLRLRTCAEGLSSFSTLP